MKTYLVEYLDPIISTLRSSKIDAMNMIEARRLFFENYNNVKEIIRITWVPRT